MLLLLLLFFPVLLVDTTNTAHRSTLLLVEIHRRARCFREPAVVFCYRRSVLLPP